METYAEKEVFTPAEKMLWRKAVELVERVPYEIGGEPVRCHELARAVGHALNLHHQDGRFGFVEHTWLWLDEPRYDLIPWVSPNILDVYVPGSMPSVQLVHMASGLPSRYTLNPVRDLVVRDEIVTRLIDMFYARAV